MTEYDIIKIALDEIREVLLDETDYGKEGDNISFLKEVKTLPQKKGGAKPALIYLTGFN
jgi:hypothetical protein